MFFFQYYILLGLTHLSTNNCRYKGLFRSQDVAIKVFKADSINGNMQREFAQEVYILRLISNSCSVIHFLNTLVTCIMYCRVLICISLLFDSGKFGTRMWYNLLVRVQDLHSCASLLVMWIGFWMNFCSWIIFESIWNRASKFVCNFSLSFRFQNLCPVEVCMMPCINKRVFSSFQPHWRLRSMSLGEWAICIKTI